MKELIVDLNHVWKKYPFRKDRPGFKESVVNFYKFLYPRGEGQNRDFYVLKDLTLQIRQRECVGIIGRNGAGKSTLLSLILGTIYPTKGDVKVSEKVTPLLELGAGFHPDLTGRENIVINGVLLGLTKNEVMERMESIIRFSEIIRFIDMPVRTYSSGMYLRLAFSIAIHTEPKLLLIDEVLSVGDEAFQKKSKHALLQLIQEGVTTIFVSHNLAAVAEMCPRAIWLENGEIKAEDESGRVVEEYLNYLNRSCAIETGLPKVSR